MSEQYLTPYMPIPRSTEHYDLLIDGPSIQEVSGIDTSDEYDDYAASIMKNALRELAEEAAGTKLDFVGDSYYVEDSPYRFIDATARVGHFDIDEITEMGTSMEFAGPTDRTQGVNALPGYTPDIVTNMTMQPPGMDEEEIGKIDALTDATNMPVADNSLGSVHIAALNRFTLPRIESESPLRYKAIDESTRVLKEGGFLIWDGGNLEDHDRIIKNGFKPTFMEFNLSIAKKDANTYAGGSIQFNGVYRKLSTPKEQIIDPNLLGEISLENEIASLRQNPMIGGEDLFSSKKMQSGEYPDKPGLRVALGTPIETAVSDRSDVEQDLMAVISLGKDIALGVVTGKDKSGGEITYISLLNNKRSENEGRARFVDVLAEGKPITIGREKIEQSAGREETAPGVSGTHCTIELRDGVLTVVDETSTNGTSVFTNTTNEQARQFNNVLIWSQPSRETKKLIDATKEAETLSRASQLGRFTVENS